MKKSFFISFFFLSLTLFSQEKEQKVGLVLSGGGAKGFAHIGVLKEIDKAGLTLDYIGGTSMGAIIGGLYAVGYSGIQIEKIIKETDFLTLLSDKLPRSTKPFFEKEFGEKTAIALPVKAGAISLPKGVSKGQNVLNFLLELLEPAEGINDFSKLPIPFFCIATDVENGEPVLLEKGSLPLALRASGSFPTLLNPVDLNGKLLVDGGIANNFPISIMKSKGIDIVIGVDVEGRLYKKDKLNSVIAIMNQIVSYQMYQKSAKEKKFLDVYIHPDIFNFNVVDFDKKEEILAEGDKEAKKFSAVFDKIKLNQPHKKNKNTLIFKDKKYLVSEIGLKGTKNYTRAFVLGKLKIKVWDSISRKEITKRIQLLSATKNYDRVDYTIVKNKKESYKLNFFLIESENNANIKLGAHYDDLYKSSVLANFSKKYLLLKNDVFSLDLILGDNLRYNLNYFVDNGFYLSYGFRTRYNRFRSNSKFNPSVFLVPNEGDINVRYRDITSQFFVQTTFDRKFAIGLGIEYKHIKATTKTFTTNNEETVFDNSSYFNTFGYVKLDTYDDKLFPTKGYFADLNAKWYMDSSDYNNNFNPFLQAKGTLGFATSFWNKLTLKLTSEAGFNFNNTTSNMFNFHLGGYNKNYINTFSTFYGYDFAELSDRSFLKTAFNFRYAITDKHYALFIANYGRLEENVFNSIDLFDDIKSGYALGYSYNTFIGPIEIKYSWSPDNNKNFWLFNLGFWF